MTMETEGEKPTDAVEQSTSTPQTDWDTISYVISSEYRICVIKELASDPATPSQLEERTGRDIAHMSRAIQELQDRNIVDLLVSEDRHKGRIYGLTEKGHHLHTDVEASINGGAER